MSFEDLDELDRRLSFSFYEQTWRRRGGAGNTAGSEWFAELERELPQQDSEDESSVTEYEQQLRLFETADRIVTARSSSSGDENNNFSSSLSRLGKFLGWGEEDLAPNRRSLVTMNWVRRRASPKGD